METEARIEYRKVRNIRLEYGTAGLRVVVPIKFRGNVEDIIARHSDWIAKRKMEIARLNQHFERIALEKRTDQTLRILIRGLLTESASEIGRAPKQVKYRNMRTRWGSCSSAGVITFSTRLKHLPERLVAFVVHHEVAHLKVMKHNVLFWEIMARKFVDYKQLKKELQLYGMALDK